MVLNQWLAVLVISCFAHPVFENIVAHMAYGRKYLPEAVHWGPVFRLWDREPMAFACPVA